MIITVVIPTLNGAVTLEACLQAISNQKVCGAIQIVIIDSGSIDNTLEIAESFGCRIIKIAPKEFNHGLTRNLGVHAAQGELLYFTVQDAEMSNELHLHNMTKHFVDLSVHAVVGIQGYPHRKDVNPALWFKQYDRPTLEVRHFPVGTFDCLTNSEQFKTSAWDNVNAMYRKSVLLEIPFAETNFSEDWIWANSALISGKKILRDTSLLVWHYHHMDFMFTLRSNFIIHYYFFKFFDQKPQFNKFISPLIRRSYTLIFRRTELSIPNKIFWISHNISFLIANQLSVLLFYFFILPICPTGLEFLYRVLCNKVPQGSLKQ